MKCPRCDKPWEKDAFVCVHCGYPNDADPSRTLITNLGSEAVKAVLSGWGTDQFEDKSRVIFYFDDASIPVVITPEDEYVLGRSVKSGKDEPDFDLTPYGAVKKGVSRRHAALRRSAVNETLQLVDLGSRNGTFLNEERLPPEIPHTLRDGDLIRMGNLILYVYFK